MNDLWSFLKQYVWCGVYLALCICACGVIFALCGLPLAPVLYVLGLCLFLGLVFLAVGYVRFWRKHRLLQGLMGMICLSIAHLPETGGPLEGDYQALLRQLFAAKTELETSSSRKYQDLLEYYTLWVHQIKTPISAMDLLLQRADTPEYLELRAELFKIQQYVEMVLCYLRLDSETSDFVFRTCGLDGILRESIRTYAGQFIRRKVKLCYEPVELQVLTDAKWLQFVVEQLLSNALKYAPGGTVTIRLEGERTLVIQDDGIGIAPEDLPRIFEKGYTGLNGRGNQRSTGIGLYLCRRIMERLGNEIAIESEPGRGTRVLLKLERKSLEFD